MRGFVPVLGMAAVGLSLLAGCPDRSISKVTPEQGRVEYKDIPVTVNRNVDLLFVIDDSPSMADKQQNLADNFGEFINVLNTIQGGLPDVHIGVVTSDMGTKSTQDPTPGPSLGGCAGTGKAGNLQISGAPVSGTFISDIKVSETMRNRNYTGDLATVFATMAKVGAAGCGFEQHLSAMKAALNGNQQNAGFLRADAYLAIIFIQDEDDCSISHTALLGPAGGNLGTQQSFRCTKFGVTCDQGGADPNAMNTVGNKSQCHPNEDSQYLEKVQTYVDFIKGLKADPTKIIVAGIMGTIDPFAVELRVPQGASTAPEPALAHSCTYQGSLGPEIADPPIRLKYFLDQFPNRSTFTTICQRNLADGLTLIAQLLKTVLGDPCIEGNLAMPIDCSVSDVQNLGEPNQVETILPACNSDTNPSNTPCWRIATDTVNCAMAPGNHTLKIERGSASAAPDTHVIANCVTESD
ncbi:hypothetical protein BH11MYX2_BH11MYX2_06810 [soil metagenome]